MIAAIIAYLQDAGLVMLILGIAVLHLLPNPSAQDLAREKHERQVKKWKTGGPMPDRWSIPHRD